MATIMNEHILSRRAMLQTSAAGIAAHTFGLPAFAGDDKQKGKVRFGLITDVHQDIMHDGEDRLRAFIDAMKKEKPDFIAQLGDFCVPIERNQPFLDIFNEYEGPRYHVLGNHDMDGNTIKGGGAYSFTREQTMAYWSMPARYYAFDHGPLHFIVLDGNDKGPGQKPYYRYIGDEQLDWLKKDLEETKLPTIVFSHQPVDDHKSAVENHAAVQTIFEKANESAGFQKVLTCFSGHLHRDYCKRIGGILHAQINSASYKWLGGKYTHDSYSKEIHEKHPYIKYTSPYRDPLWAVVTIDLDRGVMEIEGRTSQWVGPSPWDVGADRVEHDAGTIRPTISDRGMLLVEK